MQNNEFIGKVVTLTFPNGATFTGLVQRRGRALVVTCGGMSHRFGYYNSADGGENVAGFTYTVALATPEEAAEAKALWGHTLY